ncbi:MAG: aldo/keto reductase [Candidatus Vogelbacteria bacterium]|nr:aldo/keto reductase [Candidatus Vogelbacteria bacterium]
MSKLALGTVQFGLNYGINNVGGIIPQDEVFLILDEASKSSLIEILDTASVYGASEKVIGEYAKSRGKRFNVVSKVPNCKPDEIEDYLNKSLNILNLSSLYGYIFHDFNFYLHNPSGLDKLIEFKQNKKINKIGFSLYYPDDLDRLLSEKIAFDLVQVPFSVFDQRFVDYFDKLKSLGVEIHVRSIFLQGLAFKNPGTLTGNFEKIKEKITYLNNLALSKNVSIVDICLAYGITNNFIDKVVFGVDSLSQLKDIISSSRNTEKLIDIVKNLNIFKIDDEEILIPSKWNNAISTGATK